MEWKKAPRSITTVLTTQRIMIAVCVFLLLAIYLVGPLEIPALPIWIILVNALFCSAFWIIRTKVRPAKYSRRTMGVVALLSSLMGASGSIIIASVLVVLFVQPKWFRETTPVIQIQVVGFWILAGLELIHNHAYKLTSGKRDTLSYVLSTGNWSALGRPLTGAIGIQIKKIRKRQG
jgi:hypothetical protein